MHGKADARGLTGAEIAQKDLKVREREAANRERTVGTPDEEEGLLLIADTPPRSIGESQGGTSITLAIRSPETPRQVVPPQRGQPIGPPIFRLFPAEPIAPPASTAPSRLEEQGRGKRKREHTKKYQDAMEDGLLDESQHGKQ
jgi:hypothetical protein